MHGASGECISHPLPNPASRTFQGYFTLNFLLSLSNTSLSPVMSRTSNKGRMFSSLECGMPSTRALPLSTVFHTVGKSFPFCINSVHSCAKSCARPRDIS